MEHRPTPALDPERLKTERHDVDLGTEEQAEGHDRISAEHGRQDGDNAPISTIPGAVPPAR